MSGYRMDFFAPGHFVRTERIEAGSDAEAINRALVRSGVHSVELWCGARRVQTFPAVERRLLCPPMLQSRAA